MDVLTPEQRSFNMSRIRGKNTGPEFSVRSLLHKLGYRFRLHRKDLPGKPDIVLPKHKSVIFVHGCFWHVHSGCKYSSMPKTDSSKWKKKLMSNVERDRRNTRELKKLGWRVLIIWECQIIRGKLLERRISRFLSKSNA